MRWRVLRVPRRVRLWPAAGSACAVVGRRGESKVAVVLSRCGVGVEERAPPRALPQTLCLRTFPDTSSHPGHCRRFPPFSRLPLTARAVPAASRRPVALAHAAPSGARRRPCAVQRSVPALLRLGASLIHEELQHRRQFGLHMECVTYPVCQMVERRAWRGERGGVESVVECRAWWRGVLATAAEEERRRREWEGRRESVNEYREWVPGVDGCIPCLHSNSSMGWVADRVCVGRGIEVRGGSASYSYRADEVA